MKSKSKPPCYFYEVRQNKKILIPGRKSPSSQYFEAALSDLGKRPIKFEPLSLLEKAVINALDIRWEMGPDGVLLWARRWYFRAKSSERSADFQWLKKQAQELWISTEGNNHKRPPKWINEWADAWSGWAHRYFSIQFDTCLKSAVENRDPHPIQAANAGISKRIAIIARFFLEYFSKSSISLETGKWPTPDFLLLRANHPQDNNNLRDELWTLLRATGDLIVRRDGFKTWINRAGSRRSLEIQRFLDFVSRKLSEQSASQKMESVSGLFATPFLPRSASGVILVKSRDDLYRPAAGREHDRLLSWIERDHPHLRAWQTYAVEYIQSGRNVVGSMRAISIFIGQLLATAGERGKLGQDFDRNTVSHPLEFLRRSNSSRALISLHSISENLPIQRGIYAFMEYILLHYCSLMDEGGPVRMEGYHNPFAHIDQWVRGTRTPFETIREAMPYEWIKRLRGILVQGPHFKDWTWAHGAQTSEHGTAKDWFKVSEDDINKSDPDCVWRERVLAPGTKKEKVVLEIWSPVRWVALLTKLCTALRTVQVRMLDSGESDDLRFDLAAWASMKMGNASEAGTPWIPNNIQSKNPALSASVAQVKMTTKRRRQPGLNGIRNGVLRPVSIPTMEGMSTDTVLYINTNKTADIKKEGASKGFEAALPMNPCPLQIDENGKWVLPILKSTEHKVWLEDLAGNIHWWLAKLRNWQENYNPIDRRTNWHELSGTGIYPEKTDEQFATYTPACFLFREPAKGTLKGKSLRKLPIADGVVFNAWWSLNKKLEAVFAQEGKKNKDGSPITLVLSNDSSKACTFDLHSIRVSLITALVVDGKVPMEIVQRLVGHSRIVMTLYYTKISNVRMRQALSEGMKRINEQAAYQELQFLKNASIEDLRSKAAFHDEMSAFAALGMSKQPCDRSTQGWTRVVGGYCPVGAVARNTEGGLHGGCFNGGELVGAKTKAIRQNDYGPVTGGERSCSNCRWFITTPAYIPELVAIFEVTQYRVFEHDERAMALAIEHRVAVEKEDAAHAAGSSPKEMAALQRIVERTQEMCSAVAEQGIALKVTLGNTYRLIRRCIDIVNRKDELENGNALVMSGGTGELGVILEETTSEMLQLMRISQHAEVFPEIDPGKAILKSSEIMAMKLGKEGLDPFLLIKLTESQRCKVINILMQKIARQLCPTNDEIGFRSAVKLIESPQTIADALGLRPSAMKSFLERCETAVSAPLNIGCMLISDHPSFLKISSEAAVES